MSTVKLTKEELTELLQSGEDKKIVIQQLGNLEVQKQSIKLQKQKLLQVYENIAQRQNSMAKQLEDKYGRGTVNVEDGTFTPL